MTHDDTREIIGTLKMFSFTGAFDNALLLVKIAMIIALVAGAVALALAVARRVSGAKPRSGLLATMGWVGLSAGVAGALYDGLIVAITANEMHTTRFVIILPELMEIACVLLLGLLVWAIAVIGNAGARR